MYLNAEPVSKEKL